MPESRGTPLPYPSIVLARLSRVISTITLTMDTYGHLFPGQEADAVDRLRHMLVDDRSTPQSLRQRELPTGLIRTRNLRCSWRSSQDAKRCDRLRHRAINPPRRQRKRIRPSPCELRTWTMRCECLRHLAKVAEEGFEPPPRGLCYR